MFGELIVAYAVFCCISSSSVDWSAFLCALVSGVASLLVVANVLILKHKQTSTSTSTRIVNVAHTAYTDSTTVAASKPLPLLLTVVVRGAVIVVAVVVDVAASKPLLLLVTVVVRGAVIVVAVVVDVAASKPLSLLVTVVVRGAVMVMAVVVDVAASKPLLLLVTMFSKTWVLLAVKQSSSLLQWKMNVSIYLLRPANCSLW